MRRTSVLRQKATVAGLPGDHAASRDASLSPKHTFDTFVAGESNHLACAAARKAAEAPGQLYNPLLVCGGVGLGKTHLLHAIGREALLHRDRTRVVYVSSERFRNEYSASTQDNRLERFRHKYRQADLLLMDDLQFLAGADGIQEEFLHTFNALYEAQKQIVLSCDRPLRDLPKLELPLLSRLESGLVTYLQPPDRETRLTILRRRAQALGVQLPEEILAFLADRIRNNVRSLEGALVRVASYKMLIEREPSVAVMEDLLRELLDASGRSFVNIQLIQEGVAEHFHIPLTEMMSRRRSERTAFPRQVAMYLARQLTENSLTAIGEAFGGRYHGTVLHACHLVENRMENEPRVREAVQRLKTELAR